MLLFGASGHAKVICSILEANNVRVEAIFDDNITIKNLDQYPVIGSYDPNYLADKPLIISIGNNQIRKKIAQLITHSFGVSKHPSAIVDELTQIGEGTVVFHGAIIQRGSRIGKHVIVNTKASIDHDCEIGDFGHISPGSVLCGTVQIGEGTQIGAGAVVLPNLKVGKWCKVGAGAVVTKNIPDYAVVVGVPGQIIKINQNE